MWIGGEQFNVIQHCRGEGGSVERVEGLTTGGPINEECGPIDEECMHAQVGGMCLEGHMP